MRPVTQSQSTRARNSSTGGTARWVFWMLGAIFLCGAIAIRANAQSSQLHAAFEDVHRQLATDEMQNSEDVRLASAQKPAAAQPPAKAAQPPARQQKKPAANSLRTPEAGSAGTTEALPPPPMKATVPLIGSESVEGLQFNQNDNGLITLIVRDKSLSQVLALLAQTQNLNIVASNDIDALISITLRDVPMEEALTAILSVANYTWVKRNNIILITSLTDATNLPADVQGRQIQVFDLDFASATVVAETVNNFLSPVGKISVSASNSANNRLTQERIVVEDLPEALARIATYIAQIDQAPRQVLIEAHVLQVTLDDTTRCGVDLNNLVRLSGSNLNVTTTGFANKSAPQAFLATLEGGDLGGVIELLETSTDAKTLGSPKLLVLNEQEARLQVGEHLGFKVTTTTETSTLESVQFLDVGVVLRITPRITRDGRVLLHVKPEVSKGAVNPETGLPESQTTELETDVMLDDGQGMVIGGLIKENDTITQSKVPYLGNVKGIGFMFRRSEVTKERSEIIVALVPRIQPYDKEWHDYEQGELVKAGVPLLHGPLCRTDRPWDPVLPDGRRVYYPLIPKKHPPKAKGHFHNLGSQYVIPPYPLPTEEFCDESCESEGPMLPNEELPSPTAGNELHGSQIISDHQ